MHPILTRTLGCHFLNVSKVSQISNQKFWGMVDFAFNRVEKRKREKYGADRSCAEWLLRNGAILKWKGIDTWQLNYNALPDPENSNLDNYKIEIIDVTESGVTGLGFRHLEGLNDVKKVILHKSRINDEGVARLKFIKHTLEDLQVSQCPDVSASGLRTLAVLTKLRKLKLFDLELSEKKFEEEINNLKKQLPQCSIDTTSVTSENSEK